MNKGKRHSPCGLCLILRKNCPLEYDSKTVLFFMACPKGFDSQHDTAKAADDTPFATCFGPLGSDDRLGRHSLPRVRILYSMVKHKKTTPLKRCCFLWPARKDSNLRPSESESDALSSCATGRCYRVIIQQKQT